MERRVVITGLGVLTSNAEGIEDFSSALKEGRNGVSNITQFDTGKYSCKIGGEIKSVQISQHQKLELDRASFLVIETAKLALSDARLDPSVIEEGRLGAILATTCGGVLSLEEVSEALETNNNVDDIPTWKVDELSFFAMTQHLAKVVKATGPVMTVAIACSSGGHAIGVAADLIRSNQADVMIAGGVDVISRFIYRGFAALNGLGNEPYRAFDKNRNGVVLGEGAGIVVLESLEHAQKRGQKAYVELAGHSFNNDGFHIVNPNPTGEGIARSINMALKDAGISPSDIDHLNAHGTGTLANDSAETAGFKLAFGTLLETIPVTSIKPMIGHTSGAAGAVELIAAIASLKSNFIPPTINWVEVDPDCNVSVANKARNIELKTILSANSGFGGSNAAVIVKKIEITDDTSSNKKSNWIENDLDYNNNSVFITGCGAILPGLFSLNELDSYLFNYDPKNFRTQHGLEIPNFDLFEVTGLPISKETRRMDLFSQYTVKAAFDAMKSAGLDIGNSDESLGLLVGSAYSCLESNEKFVGGLWKLKVNPVIYQNTVSNSCTGYACMLLGAKGPVSVINQGYLSGSAAIAYGFDLIKRGYCEKILVGGAERLCKMSTLPLLKRNLLTNDNFCKPYDELSSGTILSEGGTFFLLESEKSAKKRNAKIFAKMHGYSFQHELNGLNLENSSSSLARTTRNALNLLNSSSNLVVYTSANGISFFDKYEKTVLSSVLNELAPDATICPTKQLTGETQGLSGPFALALAISSNYSNNFTTDISNNRKTFDNKNFIISSMDLDGSCVSIALSSNV